MRMSVSLRSPQPETKIMPQGVLHLLRSFPTRWL
jgi:hypothetical protein